MCKLVELNFFCILFYSDLGVLETVRLTLVTGFCGTHRMKVGCVKPSSLQMLVVPSQQQREAQSHLFLTWTL